MTINSLNLQNKVAFSSNPYNSRSGLEDYTKETIGKEVLIYAKEGSDNRARNAKANGAEDFARTCRGKSKVFDAIINDQSKEGKAFKEQIGEKIRTYA